MCGRQVGRWQLDSKTERSLRCLRPRQLGEYNVITITITRSQAYNTHSHTPVSQFFNLTGKTFRQIAALHEPAAPTLAMVPANEEVGGLGPSTKLQVHLGTSKEYATACGACLYNRHTAWTSCY